MMLPEYKLRTPADWLDLIATDLLKIKVNDEESLSEQIYGQLDDLTDRLAYYSDLDLQLSAEKHDRLIRKIAKTFTRYGQCWPDDFIDFLRNQVGEEFTSFNEFKKYITNLVNEFNAVGHKWSVWVGESNDKFCIIVYDLNYPDVLEEFKEEFLKKMRELELGIKLTSDKTMKQTFEILINSDNLPVN